MDTLRKVSIMHGWTVGDLYARCMMKRERQILQSFIHFVEVNLQLMDRSISSRVKDVGRARRFSRFCTCFMFEVSYIYVCGSRNGTRNDAL